MNEFLALLRDLVFCSCMRLRNHSGLARNALVLQVVATMSGFRAWVQGVLAGRLVTDSGGWLSNSCATPYRNLLNKRRPTTLHAPRAERSSAGFQPDRRQMLWCIRIVPGCPALLETSGEFWGHGMACSSRPTCVASQDCWLL